jgi:DNA primase
MRRSDLKVIHGWVSTRCPIARWTHEKGGDSAPSAGVSIGEQPIFNCFTCSNKRPLHSLVAKYAEYTGDNFDDLITELEEHAFLGPTSLPDWDSLKHTAEDEGTLMPLNEAVYMGLYESAAGHPYLERRGISSETARKLELLYDPEDFVDKQMGKRKVARILFPVRGPDGALYGFSGRDVTGKSPVKVRDYAGLKKAACVLGAHLAAADNPKEVLTVEGLFDYAMMHEQGYYGCAVMHSSLTDAQADIFRDLGKPNYLFYDDDAAGDKGVKEATRLLVEYIPLMRVRYPEIWVENPDEEDGGHYVKDPGELLREDIEWMMNDAQIIVPARRPAYKKKGR